MFVDISNEYMNFVAFFKIFRLLFIKGSWPRNVPPKKKAGCSRVKLSVSFHTGLHGAADARTEVTSSPNPKFVALTGNQIFLPMVLRPRVFRARSFASKIIFVFKLCMMPFGMYYHAALQLGGVNKTKMTD